MVDGSVADPAAVRKAVAGCEVVYHLAAVASVVKSVEMPGFSHEVCATGTLNVLDAARQPGVRRVVYAGSAGAYGDQPGDMRSEDDALIPLSPYAAAKLAGEHYCTAFTAVYGLETVRLRFFNVFGPRQDPKSPYSGVIAIFSDAMKAGKTPTIFGDGLQARLHLRRRRRPGGAAGGRGQGRRSAAFTTSAAASKSRFSIWCRT